MTKVSRGIVGAVGSLTALIVVSKIFGLVREMAIAGFYGTTASTDAYFLASGFVTNIFFGITAALSTVFLPHYIKCKSDPEIDESKVCSSIISSLSVFSVLAVVLMFFVSPYVVAVLAPSYSGEMLREAVLYMRIYSVSILFSLLTSMLTALMNAERRYVFPAICSIAYSTLSVACMVFLKNQLGVAALAISVPLSFFVQFVILAINARKYLRFIPTLRIFNSDVKYLLLLMLPVLLGNATVEINQLVTRSIAAGLEQGNVSVLTYSNTLFNFVSTLIVSTVVTVMFTELSEAEAQRDQGRFIELFAKALNALILVVAPIALVTAVFSFDVVKVVYGRGAFTDESVIQTSRCLAVYAAAFVVDALRNMYVRAYYARGNTKTPLISSFLSFAVTVGGSLLLAPAFGVLGIVASISASIVVSLLFLALMGRNKIARFGKDAFLPTLWRLFLASTICLIVLCLMNSLLVSSSILRFLTATVTGGFSYFAVLVALKCPGLAEVALRIKGKLAKG